MSLCLHKIHVPFLETVVPGGMICPEAWAFGLLVQLNYYRVDLLTAVLYSAWCLPQLVLSAYLTANQTQFTLEVLGE